MTARWPAALVLENGRIFKGEGFGGRNESIGEVVFNTSITGYQEIVSDPSYAGQIVVMTAPQIGNVGVNKDDVEAKRVVCAGLVIRELSPIPASWRSENTLPHWLDESKVPGIDGIDTRALTRVLRDEVGQHAVDAKPGKPQREPRKHRQQGHADDRHEEGDAHIGEDGAPKREHTE